MNPIIIYREIGKGDSGEEWVTRVSGADYTLTERHVCVG